MRTDRPAPSARLTKQQVIGGHCQQGRDERDEGAVKWREGYESDRAYQERRDCLALIIRGVRPYYLTHFIGSQLQTTDPAADLHEITILSDTPESQRYVIVRLRLFAPYKTPAHLVVAGEWR